MKDYHLVDIRHEKVSPFVKLEIILPLFVFYLDPTPPPRHKKKEKNKALQNIEFYDKLVDRFQDLSKVNILLSTMPRFNYNYLELSIENVWRNMML